MGLSRDAIGIKNRIICFSPAVLTILFTPTLGTLNAKIHFEGGKQK